MNARIPNDFSLTEAVLNKIAEVYISNQIKRAQSLEISIDSKPEKIVRGEIDGISLIGKGLVILKNLTIEKVKLKLDDLALDLVEIISGNIKLERPGKLNAKIVLNSADCDRLLNSKYINTLLKSLPIEINQRLFTFEIQHVRCNLKEQARLTLVAELVLTNDRQQNSASAEYRELLPSSIESNKTEFEIDLLVAEDGKKIMFEAGKYQKDRALSLETTIAIISKIRDLLYFRHFTSSDLSFEIEAIRIEAKQLILWVKATVHQLPRSIERPLKTAAIEIN